MGHLSSEFGEIRAQRELWCKEGAPRHAVYESTVVSQFEADADMAVVFSRTQVNRHTGYFKCLAAATTSNNEDIFLRYPRRVVGTTFLCNGQEHGERRCRCYLRSYVVV